MNLKWHMNLFQDWYKNSKGGAATQQGWYPHFLV